MREYYTFININNTYIENKIITTNIYMKYENVFLIVMYNVKNK